METNSKRHTDREYEAELAQVRERLIVMAGRVEEMILNAVQALGARDATLARATIELDHKVNRAEIETDELCLRILARRQPMASDLRFITMALKLVTDLGRIGDRQTSDQCALALGPEEPGAADPPGCSASLADVGRSMLRDALDAFVAGDAERAEAVIARDRIADAYHADIFRNFLTNMTGDGALVTRATRVQSISKCLERIADHATNVAEMVVFMVSGKDIRHTPWKPPKL